MKKHLEVSAAVIEKDGLIFAAQRGNHGELALKWEFPGGKIESGETPEQALIREIQDEIINKFGRDSVKFASKTTKKRKN